MTKRKNIDINQLKLILQKNTIKEAAILLNCSVTMINRLKREHNIQNLKTIYSDIPDKNILISDYKKYSISQIAKKYKKSHRTIKKWLEYFDIPILSSQEQIAKYNDIQLPTKEELEIDYITNQLSNKEIIKKYNISKRILYTMLKNYNIVPQGWKNHNTNKRKINYSGLIDKKTHDNLNDKNWILNVYPFDQYSYIDIAEDLNIDVLTIRKRLSLFNIEKDYRPDQKRSQYEKEICKLLDLWNVNYVINDRLCVNGYECDIFIKELNFGIEFNGNYWHSDLVKQDKNYHVNKFLCFKKQNINLYQIYEYQWLMNKDKIIKELKHKLLKNKKIIYGRNTIVREIENNKEYKEFIECNHLQGYRPAKIKLGLYDKNTDELLSVMSFGYSQFDKNAEYELIRYTTKYEHLIVGGPDKLFSYFINEYKPKNIVSYSLNDRGFTTLYNRLNFKEIDNTVTPNYIWCKNKTNIKTRYQCQKHKLPEDVQSENEYMRSLGYYKIYNSGNTKYQYETLI